MAYFIDFKEVAFSIKTSDAAGGMAVSPDSMAKELCKYGRAISGEIMPEKY